MKFKKNTIRSKTCVYQQVEAVLYFVSWPFNLCLYVMLIVSFTYNSITTSYVYFKRITTSVLICLSWKFELFHKSIILKKSLNTTKMKFIGTSAYSVLQTYMQPHSLYGWGVNLCHLKTCKNYYVVYSQIV